MLISKKYNFVFIHSRKTSGSSFYEEMNKYLSEKCIQIGGWDDCLNMGGELSKFALRQLLSYRGMAKIMPKLANQVVKQKLDVNKVTDNTILDLFRDTLFLKNPAHADIRTVREKFDVSDYTSFAVARNTYDFLVSEYSFRIRNAVDISFKDYLKLRTGMRNDRSDIVVSRDLNIDLISDASGRILVDLVFHYERLSEFEKYMLGEYGLNIHFRTGRRAKANLKQNVKLDSEDVNLIKKNYAREIEFFGYEMPEHLLA